MPTNPTGVFSRGKGNKKTWWARFVFTNENGKRTDLQRRAENFAHACEIRKGLEREYRKDKGQTLRASAKTFENLADYYEENYLKPAKYHSETLRKIEGLRSWKSPLGQLRRFREFFGRKKIQSITYDNILHYRNYRLETVSERTGKQLSIASINRELALLRRMLNVAMRQGWIEKNPINAGESLICIADEKKRQRIITREEEQRLLDACETDRRLHLKLIIICALDTGMRLGEILALKQGDIDYENMRIVFRETKNKSLSVREVPLSKRFISCISPESIEVLIMLANTYRDEKLFNFTTVKKSFMAARKEAGLEDVRFHDLRHTAATRMIRQGLSREEVGKILGHTEANTTYRYINTNHETLRRVALALESYTDKIYQMTEDNLVN